MKNLRYIIEFIFTFILLKFLQLLPIWVASNICGFLGRYILYFVGSISGENKKGLANIASVFPNYSHKRQCDVLIKSYENAGRLIGEFVNQHKMTEKWFKKNVILENQEILMEYIKKGCFAMTAHFGNWEIMHRFLYLQGYDLNVIYTPLQNPYLNKLYLKQRKITQLPKGTNAMKQLLDIIKKKKSLGVVIDQRDKLGEIFTFFGRNARTSTAIQRLAAKYNYPLTSAKCERSKENPNKFIFKAYLPITSNKENMEEKITDLTNQSLEMLENWIEKSPENWILWTYSRWRINF
jgi:KDO2-lipid IV(A) lauroyltransferase